MFNSQVTLIGKVVDVIHGNEDFFGVVLQVGKETIPLVIGKHLTDWWEPKKEDFGKRPICITGKYDDAPISFNDSVSSSRRIIVDDWNNLIDYGSFSDNLYCNNVHCYGKVLSMSPFPEGRFDYQPIVVTIEVDAPETGSKEKMQFVVKTNFERYFDMKRYVGGYADVTGEIQSIQDADGYAMRVLPGNVEFAFEKDLTLGDEFQKQLERSA